MSTQLVPAQGRGLDVISRVNEFKGIAQVFAASGLFTDVRGEAQCFVKIMAGAELGIPPFTAMNSFHIIKGKCALSANAIAARVKASGRYDYRVIEKTAQKCVIEFYERGQKTHTETWDDARARKAGTQNMDKFPDAMLFARCITAGARAAAPDVVGQFYSPEELGAEVNEEGEVVGEIVNPSTPPTDSTQAEIKPEPPKQSTNGNGKTEPATQPFNLSAALDLVTHYSEMNDADLIASADARKKTIQTYAAASHHADGLPFTVNRPLKGKKPEDLSTREIVNGAKTLITSLIEAEKDKPPF